MQTQVNLGGETCEQRRGSTLGGCRKWYCGWSKVH